MSKIIQNFKNISYGPAPEDSKDVMSWINSLNNPNHLFINGAWAVSYTHLTLPTTPYV